MCGGFTCSKNALIALNVVYVVVAFLLIGVATYGKSASIITSVGVVGGIVACGVFLLFTAVLGLLGAVKHHQVMLFFYMLVLFLLFLIEFSVACACLAVNEEQQHTLAERGWRMADNATKKDAQENFQCCGLFDTAPGNSSDDGQGHPPCPLACCPGNVSPDQCCMDGECQCQPCFDKLKDAINSGLRVSGGIGLFFSFTEVIGFVLAYRYRNMMDPGRGQILD